MKRAAQSILPTRPHAAAVLQRATADGSRWWRCTAHGRTAADIVDALGRPVPRSAVWRRTADRACSLFLPDGFPRTVHPYYLPFTAWNFLHTTASSAVGVLSTQSLLCGLGLGLGAFASGSIAMSATLNWIIKDGLGQLGAIAIVAYLGGRFDTHAKRYRFWGAALLSLSCLLEIAVPLLPAHFLPLAATANILKNVAWMATSATRAQIHRHLALADNLGDLAGKTASQNTLASLLGTALGVLLSTIFVASYRPDEALSPLLIVGRTLVLFLPLSLLSLLAAYQSCRYAVSPRLSLARLETLLAHSLPHLLDRSAAVRRGVLSEIARYIHTPEALAQRERFVLGGAPWAGPAATAPLWVEPRVERSVLGVFDTSRAYWIASVPGKPGVGIWYSATASQSDIFRGIFVASLMRQHTPIIPLHTAEQIADQLLGAFRDALASKGWSLGQIDIGRRCPISILDPKDH